MSTWQKYFIENVLAAMEENNITQGWLAEEVGVSRHHINRLLKGVYVPGLELAEKIANALFEEPLDSLLNPKLVVA